MIELLEKKRVQIRFLLGPAGTGKTFRCLEEIRTELKRDPAGAPLLFLAPKQATFQIERQLLSDPELPGYTRLQILSFDRLADFLLVALGQPPPRLLNDEGRVMVLRALLTKHHEQLQLFRASARLPGFAQQLSSLLREFQRARIHPEALEEIASKTSDVSLARKLRDVATMFREYLAWLDAEKIQDADRLLDLATRALHEAAGTSGVNFRFGGLWLDGFAEMTEQELALLGAVLPWCAQATLAFCCEAEDLKPEKSFSPFALIAQTAQRCLNVVNAVVPGISPTTLERNTMQGRFSASSELAHLEAHWAAPIPFPDAEKSAIGPVHFVRATTPESEVTFAAREILRHVRTGGRFRDVAVLVRQLEPYQDIFRRVFTRYEIPFFLDRREPMAHHPVAELTRHAVRTVALNWKQEDWFGLLKSGLVGAPEDEIDWLENEALARGWEGQTWLEPIRIENDPALEVRLEKLRLSVIAPLRVFQSALAGGHGNFRPTGLEFADALRGLWRAFRVSDQLNDWAEESSASAVHATAWEQMEQWLQAVALGFAHQPVAVREWLPIMEAGLMGLTVGVIPPALDQVLVGSIDRSRNPDLRIAFILGVNEGVFPGLPPDPVLLTEADRAQLEGTFHLGASVRQQLAHERFYGYIACTRAREKLFVMFSDADRLGRKRNPSVFIAHLQKLFPSIVTESAERAAGEVCHASDLIAPLLRASAMGDQSAAKFLELPAFESVRWLAQFAREPAESKLSPKIVEQLYPQRLVTSVSRLEEFASCRFRFFVTVGLRAKERLRYEVDSRHTGTFQHDALKEFHEAVQKRWQSWRNISPSEARKLIREIAERLLPIFKNGVMLSTERNRVESQNLIGALEDFVETIVGWMPQYGFEPAAVELKFGEGGALPAWEIDLDGGRKLAFTGTIDRVDLLVDKGTRVAHAVVIDYKSSARAVDPRQLAGGVQLQLFAYLSALRKLPSAAAHFGVDQLTAAGAFYLSLRGSYESADGRDEVLASAATARSGAYKHRGRFVHELLPQFDGAHLTRRSGDQFHYRLKNDGGLYATSTDPIPASGLGELLDGVERQLVSMGNAIFAGDISVNPYRHGNKTPCEYCDYAPVCRIDRWTHEFRALPPA